MKSPLFSVVVASALAVVAQGQEGAPADPQMKAVLDAHTSLNPKPIESLSPEEARKQPAMDAAVMKVMKEQDKKPEKVADIDNTEVKLASGEVKVRIYSPKGDGPFPVILYIHGGG